MEDGFIAPELRGALDVARGRQPARAHRPEYPGADIKHHPMPEAPSSLRGGAAALSTKYAWSEWGGVPIPDVPLPLPGNPADSEMLGTRKMDGAGGARLEERAAARQRHKVQKVLDALRSQVEMHGSVAAAFRKLEVSKDSTISSEELKQALKRRFNIEMSEETTRGVIREFDVDGDGEISYGEFVQRLLGKLDIDTTGGRDGARGGGGKHVEMESDTRDRQAAAAAVARSIELDAPRRHAAAISMDELKRRLHAKYANLRDAFRAIDVDSDNTLSHAEFGTLVSEWMPELSEHRVGDVCRLLDADGDGMIDFNEFAAVMSAQGDDMRKGTSGLLREREQRQGEGLPRSRGRFGATPSFSYGVQVRELLNAFPGACGYLPEAQRFVPSVSQQLVPDWQVADAARRANRREVRREQMKFHTQRTEAIAAARQRTAERLHDARMESLLSQRQRYLNSVAEENCAKLKVQSTFRS
jgi:Ca2+-binding EF-hand superfamily protein